MNHGNIILDIEKNSISFHTFLSLEREGFQSPNTQLGRTLCSVTLSHPEASQAQHHSSILKTPRQISSRPFYKPSQFVCMRKGAQLNMWSELPS